MNTVQLLADQLLANASLELALMTAPLLLKLNLFLAAAALATIICQKLLSTKRFSFASTYLTSSQKQFLMRGVLLTAFLAPITAALVSPFIEPANIFGPRLQISQGADSRDAGQPAKINLIASQMPNMAKIQTQTQQIFTGAFLILALTLSSALYRSTRILRDRAKLRRLLRASFLLRKIGRVRIVVLDNISAPFTAKAAGDAVVFLPQALLTQPLSVKLAIRHELQHHRQRDLQWNSLFEAARFIAGWNPLVHEWLERIEETDELACDENLLGRGRIDVLDYATCLYTVAKAALTTGDGVRLAGTAGMATFPNFLKRRISMTLQRQPEATAVRAHVRKFSLGFVALALVLSTGLAWASDGLIKDRRVTQKQAELLAKKIQVTGGVPLVINKRVLNILNKATGNPRARFYMRNVLKRMKTYQPMIEAKLSVAGLTKDLMAVPAIEGGFQNTETITAAGIWQFVPETARRFGLRVDDQIDERLDAAKETDAAIAYLSANYAMFGNDWHLGLLAYNQGEKRLRDLVAETGVRDVFRLADEGKLKNEEGANYVPKIIAALIIIANPDLVRE